MYKTIYKKKQIIGNNNSKTAWAILELTYKCTMPNNMVAGTTTTDGLKP